MKLDKIALGVALVAVVIIGYAALSHIVHNSKSVFGSATSCTDGYTCFSNLEVQGTTITDGLQSVLAGVKIGSTGTQVNGVNYGSCIIHAYATTIAASTTATVDCQGGASALTALTGVGSGDTVITQATTTISSAFQGVSILSANASTTNGYITMTLFNGTGTTFTWTGAASSTIKYIDLH